jgi:D-threonate/D-erythronate kinase
VTLLVIIADDLTGAADTGACFADAGLATVISLSGLVVPEADVMVLTTESRDLEADAAARTVSEAVTRFTAAPRDSRPRWVYKKIDSVLRGHPRAELIATMDALGATRTVVAPAFPAEGRTTVGGHQRIDGVPLERSRVGGSGADSDLLALFATDRGPPVHLLDLTIVRGRSDELRRLLDDDADGIVVADAETDDDLLALGHAASRSRLRLLCGTAGLARQLVHSLPLVSQAALPLEISRRAEPILIVAGSQHKATERQILALREAGIPIVRPTQSILDDPAAAIDATVAEVAAHLAAGRSTALTTVGIAPCSRGAHSVAARLAQIVATPEVSGRVGGLVLTGGDIAAAVCTTLHVSAVWLRGEIAPGLPWGVLKEGPLHARPVATKAGSFGGDDALLACIKHLTN